MTRSLPPLIIAPHHRIQPESTIIEILLLAGWAFEIDAGERPAAEAEARSALERQVSLGLGYAKGLDGTRLFDPVETVNFIKSEGAAGRDDFWERRFVATGRRLVASLATVVGQGGVPELAMDSPRRFSLRLERRFHLGDVSPGQRLRLKMPLPLPGRYLDDVTIVPDPPLSPDVRQAVSPGRLEMSLPAPPDARTLFLGADVAFTARVPADLPDVAEPDEHYLRPEEGLIHVTERIRALAAELSQGRDPLATAEAFWSFLIDELACGPVHYDGIDGSDPCGWVLQNGWYDCQLGAALFAALCRSVGIPARIVSGHLLYPLAPTNHYWAEIWIVGRGWMPFDFLCWDLSLGGRDPHWRDLFRGACDYRMATQCFPLEFLGPMSVKLPDAYQICQVSREEALEVAFHDVARKVPLFVDRIIVRA